MGKIAMEEISVENEPPMKPFWWLPEYPPNTGGIATFAAVVAPELRARGNAPFLLVAQGDEQQQQVDGNPVVRLPLRQAFEQGDPIQIHRLKRRVVEVKNAADSDLYHIHLCEPSPLLHLSTLGTRPGPTVVTLHNKMLDKFPVDDPDSFMSRLLDESDIIVACSSESSRHTAIAAPKFAHKLVCIPNGISSDPAAPPLPNQPVLLAVGRLAAQKRFDRLIRAMPRLVEEIPNVHLHIAGDGPLREELRALAIELGVEKAITFRGYVAREKMFDVFASAQVVVAPSEYEGLPYALLEAALYGRPIVGSRTGGIDEVVVDGVSGTLVDHTDLDDNPEVLASAILDILRSTDLANKFGSAARHHVEQHLSVDSCVSAYELVYRSLTAAPVDVAVIIPAYNAQRHIAATLDSILADFNETTNESELTTDILVVDDGSTDATAEIVASYADRGVRLWSQPNLGGGLARNTGLALTKSTFIAHFDADDLWPSGRLVALLHAIEADISLDAVFGQAVEFRDHDAPEHATINTSAESVRMSTVGLVRRSSIARLGGFGHSSNNDQLEWTTRALTRGMRYEQIEKVTLQRRVHATNKSHRHQFTQDTSRVALLKQKLDAERRAH